ncbi:DUF222 domain-containing protein [Kribbella sp. NPDC055071]
MFDADLMSLSTTDLLESAVEHRAAANRADTRVLQIAQIYAARYHPSACPTRPGRRSCDGRERAVVLGGDGCPEIAEFAIAEFGVLLGISPGVAATFIGQALALQYRFPFIWARVQAGEATPWKARLIVTDCVRLSEEAARYVDRRVAPLIDSITPYRLNKIIKAAQRHADPAQAQADADEKARERGVFVGPSDEHGTKTIYIKTAAGNATRHDATLNSIADALKTFGDTRPVQHRRADAVGIIADPRYTQELLAQASEHRLQPASTPEATVPDATAAETTTTNPSHPLDTTRSTPIEPFDRSMHLDEGGGELVDAAAQGALHARLAQIKQDAYTRDRAGGRPRPGKTEIYVHLTDTTLARGTGVLRAEGIGPLLATQLAELVGHGPYVVKPVIDLNDGITVDAYEIPDRIRERIKLTQPVELFPYGTRETNYRMDLDHIQPYNPQGPPGQTNTQNLIPLGRFTHRVKTHAHGWRVRRIDATTLEWTTPHGFVFRVDPTGTHPIPKDTPNSPAVERHT